MENEPAVAVGGSARGAGVAAAGAAGVGEAVSLGGPFLPTVTRMPSTTRVMAVHFDAAKVRSSSRTSRWVTFSGVVIAYDPSGGRSRRAAPAVDGR